MAIVKYSDLIGDDGSFEKILKYLEEIEQKLLLMAKSNKQSVIAINAKDVTAIGAANAEYQKLKKELEAVQKQITKLKEVKKKDKEITHEQILEQEKQKLQMQQMRKQAKELAKEQAGLTSEYSKQSKTLRDLKNQYKDMVLQGNGATEQAAELLEQITALDTKLRDLDKSVGDSYREIGKYEEAIQNVVEELKGAALDIRLFGVSASDVGRIFGLFGDIVAPVTNRIKDYTIAVLESIKKHGVFGSVLVGLKKGFKSIKDGFKTATESAKDNLKATRDNIKANGLLAVSLKALKGGLKGAVTGLKALKVALISTGVGALVVALGSVVTYLTQMQAAVEKVERVMAGLSAAISDIISRIGLLGKAVGHVFAGQWSQAAAVATQATNNFTTSVNNSYKAGVKTQTQIQSLSKSAVNYAKKLALINRQIEAQQAKADDSTKSFNQIQEAAEQAAKKQKEYADTQLLRLEAELKVIKQQVQNKKGTVGVNDLLLQQQEKELEIIEATTEAKLKQYDLDKLIRENNRDRFERELDFAIDYFDRTKTLNEKQIGDETKTFNEREAILAETRKLADSSFANQIKLAEGYTKEKLKLDELILEKDEEVVRNRLRQYNLDDVTLGRILEILNERRTTMADLAELEKDLTKAKKESEKTDYGAQERATQLARLRTKQQREALAIEERQNKQLKAMTFKTEEERTAFLKKQEDERNQNRIAAIKEFLRVLEQQEADVTPLAEVFGTKELKDENDGIITEQQRLKTELATVNAGIAKGAQDALIQAGQKAKEEIKKLREELNGILGQALDQAEQQQKERLDMTKKAVDKQSELVERQRQRAEQGLDNTLKAEQEALAQREKEVLAQQKRLARFEKVKALYASYSSKASANDPNALANALKDFAIIEGLVQTFMTGFKKGGYTGDAGENVAVGVAHGQEWVADADTTRELGLKGMSLQEGREHLRSMINSNSFKGEPIQLNYASSNKELINAVSAVEDAVKQQERINVDFLKMVDGTVQVVETRQRGSNKTIRRKRRW